MMPLDSSSWVMKPGAPAVNSAGSNCATTPRAPSAMR